MLLSFLRADHSAISIIRSSCVATNAEEYFCESFARTAAASKAEYSKLSYACEACYRVGILLLLLGAALLYSYVFCHFSTIKQQQQCGICYPATTMLEKELYVLPKAVVSTAVTGAGLIALLRSILFCICFMRLPFCAV